MFQSVNAKTKQLLKNIPFESLPSIRAKISKLDECFKAGKYNSVSSRKDLLLDYYDLIEENKAPFADMISLEMGKIKTEAQAEVKKSMDLLKFYAKESETYEKMMFVNPSSRICPQGIVFKIVPFNFPLWIAIKTAGPNLAAGNTMLIRPPDTAPQTYELFEKEANKRGLNHIQIAFSDPNHTEEIIADERVVGATFTGSTVAGRKIASIAAKNLKSYIVELGGADPFIVWNDVYLEEAVSGVYRGRLANLGQICNSPKRVLVHTDIFDRFRDRLIAKIKKEFKQEIILANSRVIQRLTHQLGEIVSDEATKILFFCYELNGIKRTYEEASFESEIKRAVALSEIRENITNIKLLAPPVFETLASTSVTHREEIFGPVFSLKRVSSLEETTDTANQTSYGLCGSVLVNDEKVSKNLFDQIKCGGFFVNTLPTSYWNMPWGGTKDSGVGRECAFDGFSNFVTRKTVI